MQWKNWFTTVRECLANTPKPKLAASITLGYTDTGLGVISTSLEPGCEAAMAEIIFNIASGGYIDEIYQDLGSKIDENRINEIIMYLRSMSSSQVGLENLYETPDVLQDRPFVSPCNAFAGMQHNAEPNNQL